MTIETALTTVELYSDIHCPWAYLAVYRLRQVWPEYQDRVRLSFRALSLELKNRRPTPKPILDVEFDLMKEQEPELPIQRWQAPEYLFVPTFLPAFEAEKAAEQQGEDAAWEFAWQVRLAFFDQSRTVCMRNELKRVASDAGLDTEQFLIDWDSGRFRREVIAESHHGWEELKVEGSPTFILPSGKQVHNPGAMRVKLDRNAQVTEKHPADCPDGDRLQPYRAMLDEAIGLAGESEHDVSTLQDVPSD
ncbi:MAG: DsbA family protein [Chloroflexota bacterium]|nr:DsbA family protein [Chloroflexota bacterium]